MKVKATQEYAEFARSLDTVRIPESVRRIAVEQIVANIGAALGGAQMPVSARFMQSIRDVSGDGPCTAWGMGPRLSAPAAALFNSGMSQIVDWEDWVLISHVGAAIVPVAMALAETQDLSMRQVITAVVLGNEIAGRTSRAIQRGAYLGNGIPNHQVELPLVAGYLLDLDEKQLQWAVGHSCYMAMENCPIGWTTDSKLLVNGLPAMWSIYAASMARMNVLSRTDMVEHPAGFLAAVSESIDEKELTRDLGTSWYTDTLSIKRHAGCAYNLPAAECAMVLRDTIAIDDIEDVEIACSTATLYVGTRYDEFEPGLLEAYARGELSHTGLCFDTRFCFSAAYVHGDLTHTQYLVENATDPRVRALYKKVRLVPSDELQKNQFQKYKYGAVVRIRTRNGQVHAHTIEQMLGAYDRPFDCADKFHAGAEGLISRERAQAAIDLMRTAGEDVPVKSIMQHLSIRDE